MSGYIYVPVTMRGLLIGREPESNCFADISNDYSRLSFSPLGEYVPSQLSAHRDMQKGIHLHWSLPDALTRGTLNPETDDVDYPAIPNRWLMTRLWSEDGENIKAMSFLIESDAVSGKRSAELGNLGSPTIPDASNPGGFLYLGRSFRCGTPIPETAHFEGKLTAALPGNLMYTAFYPDCRNILGFYDDMTDENGRIIGNARVTYALAGWFEEWDDDPIASAPRGTLDGVLETLGWKQIGDPIRDPDGLICHAMLCAINWNGPNARYALSIPQAELSVAVGNSSSEALAAMLAGFLKSQDKALATETMLNHMLSGRPTELLSQDGIAKSEETLMESRFGSEGAVRNYSLKWDGESASSGLDESGQQAVPEPSAELARLLSAYNDAYEKQAERQIRVRELQEELFDGWFMWKRGYGTKKDFLKILDDLGGQIAVEKAIIIQAQTLLDRFDVPDGPFGVNLKEAALGEGFILAPGTTGRFWMPNPPVLLISNTAVNNAHGFDGRFSKDGLLNVRSSLISKLTIEKDVSVTGRECSIKADEITPQMPGLRYCPAETAALAVEAAILSHDFAALFAEKLLFGVSEITPEKREKLTSIIIALQSINIAVSAVNGDSELLEDPNGFSGFDGPLPEKTAVEYHKQPWFPLYMDWKVDYYPDSKVIASTPSIENWRRMGLDMTLKRKSDSPFRLVDAISVSGRTFLTPHAGQSLSEKLRELKVDIPNADSISVLSQTIPELHEQLMMRSTQMMPSIFSGDGAKIQESLDCALEGYNPVFPIFNSLFSPVRAGFLKVRSISLIDTFGQLLETEVKCVTAAESMRKGNAETTTEIMLPPRLLQPSRINFGFCGGNAICSWLLPNFFDNNITVFSPAGECLGTLQQVMVDKKDILKFKLPPASGGRAASVESAISDSDLAGFLSGIIKGGVEAFSALMQSIDSALTATNPKNAAQFNSLSFLLGRPLALVRAYVSVETLGQRREYRSYKGTVPPYPDADVSKLKIKLRLGYRHRQGDGLLGFFPESDFSVIHFTGYTKISNSYVMRGRNTDFVTVTPSGEPENLVLLMDPTADVHVTSGILPLKSLRMNQTEVQALLRNLYHVIFVAPVIQDAQSLSLPTFPVEGKLWSWSGFNRDGVFITDGEPHKSTTEAIFDGRDSFLRDGWITFKNKDDLQEEADSVV